PTMEEKDGLPHETWSAETRYGAFRTLWTIDKDDEFILGQPMNNGAFTLHVVKTPGEPMVHLSTHRAPECVIFNDQLGLRRPLRLSAGRHIMLTASAGSDTVTISRFEVGADDRQVTCSTRVADIVQTISRLGASYPDVAQMLMQADRQSTILG